jgi:hypothetical protein
MSEREDSQLRVYRIADGHLDDFVAEWRAGVLPLRERFGFRIEAWTDAAESTFVWVVRYDGPETLEEADREYYASPERAALEPDPARWIVDSIKLSLAPVGNELP